MLDLAFRHWQHVRDMSETFTKLFGSITDSTIWLEDSDTRIMWVTMLAMADRHGYVGASLPGLAARAHVPLEKAKEAIGKFMGPDPYSRSKDFEGRRVEEADRGWNILNYTRFRDMRDEESRKEYERVRKRAQRSAEVSGTIRDKPGPSRDVPSIPLLSAQAEAEAEADQNTDAARKRREYPQAFDAIWAGTGGRGGKWPAFLAWKKVGRPEWGMIAATWGSYMLSERAAKGYVKDLSTWFNQRCHEQDWAQSTPKRAAAGGWRSSTGDEM